MKMFPKNGLAACLVALFTTTPAARSMVVMI
jgi:hypothetical protein